MPGIGSAPEDFVVEEIPLYRPLGEGGHTFVQVEKRLRSSEGVRRDLARLAGVRTGEVGYAGRKDRVAVARQWFSVPGLDPERALAKRGEGFQVLEAVRHPHKLRTGQLRGNRFAILVRGLTAPDRVAPALAEMASRGMPNRFGAQRFGRDGENPARARALLLGAPFGGSRNQARFLLSALQAEAYNGVLAARLLPRGVRLRGARRPLRVRPEEATCEPVCGAVRLSFTLPPGSYATVLVEELLAGLG